MTRPVLLGGRQGLRVGSVAGWLLAAWVPVVLCLLVILRESTDAFSSAHTSAWLRHVFNLFSGPVSDDRWETVHHHIRKTGHFFGYGMVGLSWLRLWLLTWWKPLRLRTAQVWRSYAVVMALLCTMLTASCDEVHQSYLPSRTGLVSDIWLDTSGAAVMILLISTTWLIGRRSRQTLPRPAGKLA